jgi:hypothetical protein
MVPLASSKDKILHSVAPKLKRVMTLRPETAGVPLERQLKSVVLRIIPRIPGLQSTSSVPSKIQ